MSLVFNERVKLLATLLNTAAGASVTVGLFTPLAAAFYDFGGVGARITLPTLVTGFAASLLTATCLHLAAQRILGMMKT